MDGVASLEILPGQKVETRRVCVVGDGVWSLVNSGHRKKIKKRAAVHKIVEIEQVYIASKPVMHCDHQQRLWCFNDSRFQSK